MKFELQPVLIGNLVRIRPLLEGEFDSLLQVASDPLIWELHPQKDRYKKEVFQKYFEGALQSRGAVVLENKDGEIIGASRFYDYNFEKSQITIGYTFLKRSCWGGEVNREVKKLMLQHAFRFADKAIFEIGENNLRSRKAIEKIGAQLVGQAGPEAKDHVVYQIEKANFNF